MSTETEPNALNVADQLAPIPESREKATKEDWIRHYAATALAAQVEFNRALRLPLGLRPDPGLIAALGVAANAVVCALLAESVDELPGDLWDLTPEYGALNGEWYDSAANVLDNHGINPAQIDPALRAVDFASEVRPVVAEEETSGD